jgi:hypothetical protein
MSDRDAPTKLRRIGRWAGYVLLALDAPIVAVSLILVALGVGAALSVAYFVVEVKWHGGVFIIAGLVALALGFVGFAAIRTRCDAALAGADGLAASAPASHLARMAF